MDAARRNFGVAVTNAEATMQRLITEDSPEPRRVEAAMTITTYGRRMASTLSALVEARARDSLHTRVPESAALITKLDLVIESLGGSTPAFASETARMDQAPNVGIAAAVTLQDAQVERLGAQLAVLERAVARYEGTQSVRTEDSVH